MNALTPAVLTLLGLLLGATPLSGKDKDSADPKQVIILQLLGSWEIDVPKSVDSMKRLAFKLDPDKEMDQDAEAEILATVRELAESVILEFKPRGVATAHRPEGPDDATYRIVQAQPDSGRFTMKVRPEDEEEDTATCRIEGDTLFMAMEDEEVDVHLRRLTDARAATLRAAMAERNKRDRE